MLTGSSSGSEDAPPSPPNDTQARAASPPEGQEPSGQQQEEKAMQEKQGDAEERCEERSGMVEGGEEVICEVVDLYYGIEVPQVLPSSARGFWSWASTTAAAEADAAAAASKPMTKKRVLLNGVNCRICAGDMVAVIVSLRVCAISLPSIVPSFFSAIDTQSGASEAV